MAGRPPGRVDRTGEGSSVAVTAGVFVTWIYCVAEVAGLEGPPLDAPRYILVPMDPGWMGILGRRGPAARR